MEVPFEVDGKVYELGEEWATLSAENLRREKVWSENKEDAAFAVSLADKIEDYLVGRTLLPIPVTINEGHSLSRNLDAILVGAIKTKDETAEAQIRALYEALHASSSILRRDTARADLAASATSALVPAAVGSSAAGNRGGLSARRRDVRPPR